MTDKIALVGDEVVIIETGLYAVIGKENSFDTLSDTFSCRSNGLTPNAVVMAVTKVIQIMVLLWVLCKIE